MTHGGAPAQQLGDEAVHVVVHGKPVRNAVLIPGSAVLRSGERDLVFVDLGEGRFEPREVTLGISGGQAEIQVLNGVAVGEAVVTQAQFLLDSESRIQEAIGKLSSKLRVAIVLRYNQDLSYAEIGKILQCSVGTVKSRLSRAHRALQPYLKKLEDKHKQESKIVPE